ncbi:hypothetical protein B5S33_g1326 [[Candida] boidinii]|nr:hypothetical protein B5S30_g4663 [[Candida] boidinii]OWB82698.1 hypothetical protein B5S33_g1326 [[Candida] boidinii]
MELNPELRNVIMLFYLVLRALDTIEDDMTLDNEVKIPLLKSFHLKLNSFDWTFNGNGPNEKDRELLVQYNNVLIEYHKIKPFYQQVIKDTTQKMEDGMAYYITNNDIGLTGLKTLKDYEDYAYYVVGVVTEGLIQITTKAGYNDPILLDNMYLSKSMGVFIQQPIVIRDYKEDLDEGRSFLPEEVWSKYAKHLSDFAQDEYLDQGVYCISELVLDDLKYVEDVLLFLSLVYDPSAFSFYAIPATLGMATLVEIFQNPLVLRTKVKVRRGKTCSLMLRSRTFRDVLAIFVEHLQLIKDKCTILDPNYTKLQERCDELIQFAREINASPEFYRKHLKGKEKSDYSNIVDRRQLDKELFPILETEDLRCTIFICTLFFTLLFLAYFIKQML